MSIKTPMTDKRAVIIAAGDLTVSKIPVTENDYVIAVDGGLLYCEMLGITPNLVIGDFDSMDENTIKRLSEFPKEKIMALPREKDDTDMMAALRYALEIGIGEFRIYAASGGRLSHTIANIQCLKYLKEQGATGYLIDGNQMVFLAQNEEISFLESLEGYLSVFSLAEKAEGVTIKNMKYTLTDAVLTNAYPIGISNEFIGKKASVCVKNGTLLIIVEYAA